MKYEIFCVSKLEIEPLVIENEGCSKPFERGAFSIIRGSLKSLAYPKYGIFHNI